MVYDLSHQVFILMDHISYNKKKILILQSWLLAYTPAFYVV